MKRIILSITLVLFFSAWAAAESSVWKAQKGKSILYLGGTCHALRETDFPLPPEFDKAYQASDTVVFETDIGKFQDPSTQLSLLSKAYYTDGTSLDQHLSAKTYSELSAYCEANGIPLEPLRQLKPSMLMVTLTAMELLKMGVTQQGVDLYFYNRAHEDKKSIKGLETVDEQINYIASMSEGNEDQFVSYSIKEMKDIKEMFETLAAAWRKGDTERLNQLMVSDLKSHQPKLYKKLITDRNKIWMPEIDGYRKTSQTEFILVGVGHLVGPDGIIESLKKKGYKVEKL